MAVLDLLEEHIEVLPLSGHFSRRAPAHLTPQKVFRSRREDELKPGQRRESEEETRKECDRLFDNYAYAYLNTPGCAVPTVSGSAIPLTH
jgi:hypothetical protein